MKATVAALVLAGGLALTGCTSSSTTIAPRTDAATESSSGATSAPTQPAPPPLPSASPVAGVLPVVSRTLTETTLTKESTRVADAIQALLDPAQIVNVDDHSQVVTKTDGSGRYYGIIRTITLDPAVDAPAAALKTVATLAASGWISRGTSDKDGIYLGGLASSKDASAWFVVIGGDASVKGQSVFSIQLASPDIP